MKVNGDLKFRTLGSGELQNAIIERVAGGAGGVSLPTGVAGRIAYNTDSNTYWFHDGTIWQEFGGGGDITNVINSGGYMDVDGTYNPTVFNSFTNVAGSPVTNNLVEVLAQLDAAISGSNQLYELTDVSIGVTPNNGALLQYRTADGKWVESDVTGIADNDILQWNASTNKWETTSQTAIQSLGNLNDVVDSVTSGASDGQVLSFDSSGGGANDWRSYFVNFLRDNIDGRTNIDLSGGSLNPDGDGNNILFNIDVSSTETQVASFSSSELDFTAPSGTTGATIDLNAGAGSAGAGGNVTIDAGLGSTTGGTVSISGGDGTSGAGGEVSISGGGSGGTDYNASITVGAEGASNEGGNLILYAGNGTGTDGYVHIYSGSSGTGTGIIELKTAANIDLEAPYTSVTNTTAANAGVIRFQEGTTNGTSYVGVKSPDAVTTSVTYTLPVAPTDTYLLQTNGSGTLNWVDPASIGGNSFDTWANTSGTGNTSIISTTTSDTVTLVSSAGINLDFNSSTDTITFSMVVSSLTDTNTIVGADKLWFSNGPGTTEARTFTNMLADLNIVNNVSGNGMVVQTSADTYASRTITASAVNNRLGIGIVDGDGVSGNPTIGLDVVGLTDIGGVPATDDELVIYDLSGTVNRKVTVSDLTAGIVNSGFALDDISDVQATGPTAGDILVYGVGSPATDWISLQPGATSGIQAYDVGVTSIANLSLTTNDFIYVSAGSPETFSTIASGTTGRALLGDESVSDAITTLGLDSGGASDIWVDEAGDTMTGDLIMSTSARIQLTDGVVGTPSLTFAGDLDTGLYTTADNVLRVTTGSANRMTFDSSGNVIVETGSLQVQNGTAGAPGYTFESDTTKGMYNDGSGNLAFSTVGAQRLKIYGTTTAGSPEQAITGAVSVESTANYEALIGDPSLSGFQFPVDDILPNAQWVDLYYLKKSGGTMTGDLIMSGAGTDINLDGGNVINSALPTNSGDLANKAYVDSLTAGLIWLDPVWFVDLASDDINANATVDLQTPGNTTASVAGAETSDMYIVNTGGVTFTAVGVTGNSVTLSVVGSPAVATVPGDVVRFNDDSQNGQVDPYWEYIGHTSDTTVFPTNSYWGISTVTSATAAGTFANKEGWIYQMTANGTAGNNDATWVAHPNHSGSPEGPSENETFLVNNPNSGNAFRQFTFVGTYDQPQYPGSTTNKWLQVGATASITDGVGLIFNGNILNVNLGAGIFELPGDEVGIELYNTTAGAIILTTDGSTRSTASEAELHLLLDGSGGLDQTALGLKISSAGVTNDMLADGTGITLSGDAGTPTAAALGETVLFNGTNGVVVSIGAGAGSPNITDVTVNLDNVPNSALTNSSIGLSDGVNSVDEVALGEDITVTGGIAAGGNVLKFFRIEDADGNTYVQVDTDANDDSDIVSIAVDASTTTATFSATEIDLTSDGEVDINADTTVAIDSGTTTVVTAGSTLTLTGGTDTTLDSTTGDTLVKATAGSVELQASTAVEVLDNTELRLMATNNTDYIGHKSNAAVTTSVTYEWPEAPTSDAYVLVSTTGGVMSWSEPSEVGRTRLEDLDDIVVNVGSPGEGYIGGQILVASGGSPNKFESQQIQYIYNSELSGSPSVSTSHTINHNLGQKYVNATIYNSDDQQIIPQSVTLDSANAITVTFNAAIDCVVVITGVAGVTAADGS